MPRQPRGEVAALRLRVFDRAGDECEWPGCHARYDLQMAHRDGKGMGGRSKSYTTADVFVLCPFHHRCQDGEGGEVIDGRARADEVYLLYCEINPETFDSWLLMALDVYLNPGAMSGGGKFVPKLKKAISEALWLYADANRVGVLEP